ncbi:MAG: acyltransferase family protein [Flavobacteriales bacterium]
MQLQQITFTRFLAAISIVFLHFGLFTWPMNSSILSPFGGDLIAAMSYFFILSGFVLVISVAKNQQLPISINSKQFWWRRAARIVPLYLLALLFCFALFFRYDPSIPLKWQTQSWYHAFFFLQSWKYKMALDVNYPSWSLSVEAFFYFIFPWLYWNLKDLSNKKLLWISVIAWLLNYYIFLSLKEENAPSNLLHFFPLLHVATFLTGVCFGILFVRNYQWLKEKAKKYIQIAAIISSLVILYTAYKNFAFHEDQHNGLLSPYYLLVIFSLALTEGKIGTILSSKFMVFLGSMSYALYILQFPVYVVCQKYLPWFNEQKPETIFFPYLLILLTVASISYFLIEKPARKWLLKLAPNDH